MFRGCYFFAEGGESLHQREEEDEDEDATLWTTQKREDIATLTTIIIIIITRLFSSRTLYSATYRRESLTKRRRRSLCVLLLLYSVVVVVGIKKTFETHLERKRRPPKRLWFDDKEDIKYLLLNRDIYKCSRRNCSTRTRRSSTRSRHHPSAR